MKFTKIILVLSILLVNVKMQGQLFTTLFEDKNQINLQPGHLRLNTLQIDGKIYYTIPSGPKIADGPQLCVVDVNGKNGRVIPGTFMIGTNFLAATDMFIYYCSYDGTKKLYNLYRMNKATEKVEVVTYETTNKPWQYSYDYGAADAKMYTYKDKLVLVGFLNDYQNKKLLRSLCVIEDNLPVAITLSLNDSWGQNNEFQTNSTPVKDEIAITDSSIYFYQNDTIKNRKINIRFYKRDNIKNKKPYEYASTIPIAENGMEPIEYKMLYVNKKIFTLLKPLDKKNTSDNAFLFEGQNYTVSSYLKGFELSSYNVFMKAFGNIIYIGDRFHLYKYETEAKRLTLLLNIKPEAAGLLKGISFIQNQEYLLQGTDGTIFAAINTFHDFGPNNPRKNGYQKIVAINPNNTVDTLFTTWVNCAREINTLDENPNFVLGKSLYKIGQKSTTDWKTTEEWLEKYSKENNWKPIRIDIPEVKKYDKYVNTTTQPNVLQLPYGLLIKAKYYGKKNLKEKEVMYLFTE